MSKRIGILFGGIALVFCLLVARLFQLQIGSLHAARADEGEARKVVLPAARGAILDRDGKVLRATRDAFDVNVTATTFRETSLVDALADLCVLLGGMAPESGPVERARLVGELGGATPRPAIERILALDVSAALADEADDLHGRARILIEPDGTLVRPATHARRRIQDALLVVAGDGKRTPRTIRARMRERGATVAGTAGADAAGVEARIAGEQSLLARLGAELGIGDAGEVRAAIDQLCDRQFRRVEATIEERVDDAICLQEFGSWDLKRLDEDQKAELREQARLGPKAPMADVRLALCGAVRAEPGFERSRYMDARKENQTRMELAAFRHDELGWGGTFAVAALVDGPGGLRSLGFDLVASFARDQSRRHPGGVLALILGDVTRRNNRATGGLEERLDDVLRGKPGEAKIGDEGAVVVTAATHGTNARLTLSMTLQDKVQGVLDRMGAAAIVDVKTGGVLAAVSWPPPMDRETSSAIAELADLKGKRRELGNRLKEGEESAEPLLASVHDRILQSPGFHRALTFESNIPPGSVMKTVTLLAGLEAGVITPAFEIDCQTPPGGTGHFGCHRHGHVDLESAIERSCNEYCYQTVKLLGGPGPLFALYEKLGLFDEVVGAIPKGPGAYLRNAVKTDDPRNLAIGQGSLSVPAVKLAAMAASIATGRAVRAHFYAPEGSQPAGEAFASEANLAVIRSGMRRVAIGARGTAAEKFRHTLNPLDPLGIAGKTGTAQLKTGVEDSEQIYSAWFVGFAPYENPRYAFAVLIDRTHDANGADAAPYAARVIDACYTVLGGRP